MISEDVLRTDRIAGLRVAPDGRRWLLDVASATPDGRGMIPSVREYATEDGSEIRRLVVEGRAVALASPAGPTDLVVTVPDADGGTGIWRLGRAPGDEERLATWPLPVRAIRSAGGVVVIESAMHPGAGDAAQDSAIDALRQAEATLHDSEFIRFWDRRLGPRTTRLLALRQDGALRPITPGSDGLLLEATTWDLSPDGSAVFAVRRDAQAPTRRSEIVRYDTVGSAPPRTLGRPNAWYEGVRCSPDGGAVLTLSRPVSADGQVSHPRPTIVDVSSGVERIITTADTWPSALTWGADRDTVGWVGPIDGYEPLVVAAADGTVLSATEGMTLAEPQWADGTWWALRSTFFAWPHPVRLVDGEWRALGQVPRQVSGVTVSRRRYRTADGGELPSWLLLPPDDTPGPVPLIVFAVAYCPSAWTDRWFYRWNPTAWAERGYAVLMPDVRPTLAHGLATVEDGWGRWNDTALSDLLAATEEAASHPRVDGDRVGLKGGGWGAWLGSWAAANTDRFRAVVVQGGAWNLESYQAVTDQADRWEDQLGDPVAHRERYRAHSPALSLRGPGPATLIVSGERDYRAPLADAVHAARDLRRAGTDVRLLVFDDEGHRIGRVTSERLWYDTVGRWFGTHLRGEDWAPPPGLE